MLPPNPGRYRLLRFGRCGTVDKGRPGGLPIGQDKTIPSSPGTSAIMRSAHATIRRTNSGSSCRWLRMIPSLGTITALLCAGVRSRSLDSQRSLSSRTFKSSPEFAPAIQLGRFRPATRPAQPYDSGLEYWLAFDFPRQKLLSPAAYDPLLWWASRKSPRRPMRPDFPRPRSLPKRPLGWTMPLWTSDLRSDGVGAGRSLKAGSAVIKYPRSLEIHAAINLRLGRSVKSLFGGPVESP